jgi:D-xylose transport system ATP-binding protein
MSESNSANPDNVLLDVENVSLAFGSVQALREVSLTVRRGEVTALVGDNGAGKSTLVRCISGIHRPDAGHIVFDGTKLDLSSPEDAREAGIETVHQNLALVEDLTVWQNLFLNRELVRRIGPVAFLDRRSMERQAEEMVSTLAVNVPAVHSRVRRLSGGQRQAVAICRAAGFSSTFVIMDEPTAALGPAETAQVRNLVRQLKADGIGIFLISHDIHDVYDLADRVSVMYHGRIVDTVDKNVVNTDDILGMIILGKKPGDVTQTELRELELRG